MAKKINKKSINLRYNTMTVFTYIIGIILIVQLFNLQIIHGKEYREESNTRLTRESTLLAARGEILDRSGNVLVTSSQKFNVELYKSKIDNKAEEQASYIAASIILNTYFLFIIIGSILSISI